MTSYVLLVFLHHHQAFCCELVNCPLSRGLHICIHWTEDCLLFVSGRKENLPITRFYFVEKTYPPGIPGFRCINRTISCVIDTYNLDAPWLPQGQTLARLDKREHSRESHLLRATQSIAHSTPWYTLNELDTPQVLPEELTVTSASCTCFLSMICRLVDHILTFGRIYW